MYEGEDLSFYEIILRARQRREIVIGYRPSNAEKSSDQPLGQKQEKEEVSKGCLSCYC